MNASLLAPTNSARCSFAVYTAEGAPAYISPEWRACVGADYAPPIPEPCRDALFFPDPIPHTAIRNSFSLGGQRYTLFTLLPQAAEEGDSLPPPRRLEAAARLFDYVLQHATRECAYATLPADHLFTSALRLIREEISASCRVEIPAERHALVRLDHEGFLLVLAIALPAMFARGDGYAALTEDEGVCSMRFSGGRTVQNAFLRELIAAIAARGGFTLSFTERGFDLTVPRFYPHTFTLYSQPAGNDRAGVKIGLMIRD